MGKYSIRIFLVASIAFTSTNGTPSFAYTTASDLVFFNRSPSFTQQSLDSDVRLRSMGYLNLAIRDQSNEIGLFKYGNAPAGLALDYPANKAELSYWGERGTLEDKSKDADLFTGDIYNADHNALSGMTAIHFRPKEESEGSLAIAGFLEKDKATYSEAYDDFSGARSLINEPSLKNLQGGYGHRIGNLLFGMGFNSGDDDNRDSSGTSASNIHTTASTKDRTTEIVPSIGYRFPFSSTRKLSVVFSPRIRHEKIDDTTTSSIIAPQIFEQDKTGILWQGGVHYACSDALQAALFITKGTINGDETSNGSHAGDNKTKSSTVKARGYFMPAHLPFSFGGEIVYADNKNTGHDVDGRSNLDEDVSENNVGIGGAYHFPNEKGLIGLDFRLIAQKDEDFLASSVLNERGTEVALGGEISVIPRLWLRAGLNLERLAQTPTDKPTLNLNNDTVTLGAEYEFLWGEMVLAFAHTTIDSNGVTGVSVVSLDKEAYTGNSATLVTRIHFGSRIEGH